MKFSPDTSRLVEGRWYWYTATAHTTPYRVYFDSEERDVVGLWGDECRPPLVEVEPERPAWVPPVCPAGQFFVSQAKMLHQAGIDGPLPPWCRFPAPAWPPRIGEIVEVLIATTANREQWVQHLVTSGVERYVDSNEYIRCGDRVISRAGEGRSWRWVYRDLSDYTPPGGGQ